VSHSVGSPDEIDPQRDGEWAREIRSHRGRFMAIRNIYHEDGTIPLSEVDARRLNALIYREYLDPGYLDFGRAMVSAVVRQMVRQR
jgi:hypothetical protein